MALRKFCGLFVLMISFSLFTHAKEKPCVSAEEAAKQIEKDVCVSAHIYDVVQLPDGTRFMDVCPPDTTDENCSFTIFSLWDDRDEVGDLSKYRGTDVHLRGIIRPMHGRAGLALTHARQFNGGAEKFRPNPRLLRGFSGSEDRPPIHDPNLQPQGRGRSFMNTKDREVRPTK